MLFSICIENQSRNPNEVIFFSRTNHITFRGAFRYHNFTRLLTCSFHNFTRVIELGIFVDCTHIIFTHWAIYLEEVYLKATLAVNSMPIVTIPIILLFFKTILTHEKSICIWVYHLIRITLINWCLIYVETVKLRLHIFFIYVPSSLVKGSESKGR